MGSSSSEIPYSVTHPNLAEVEQLAQTFEQFAQQIRRLGPSIISVGGYFRNTRTYYDLCIEDFVVPVQQLFQVGNEVDFHFEIENGRTSYYGQGSADPGTAPGGSPDASGPAEERGEQRG